MEQEATGTQTGLELHPNTGIVTNNGAVGDGHQAVTAALLDEIDVDNSIVGQLGLNDHAQAADGAEAVVTHGLQAVRAVGVSVEFVKERIGVVAVVGENVAQVVGGHEIAGDAGGNTVNQDIRIGVGVTATVDGGPAHEDAAVGGGAGDGKVYRLTTANGDGGDRRGAEGSGRAVVSDHLYGGNGVDGYEDGSRRAEAGIGYHTAAERTNRLGEDRGDRQGSGQLGVGSVVELVDAGGSIVRKTRAGQVARLGQTGGQRPFVVEANVAVHGRSAGSAVEADVGRLVGIAGADRVGQGTGGQRRQERSGAQVDGEIFEGSLTDRRTGSVGGADTVVDRLQEVVVVGERAAHYAAGVGEGGVGEDAGYGDVSGQGRGAVDLVGQTGVVVVDEELYLSTRTEGVQQAVTVHAVAENDGFGLLDVSADEEGEVEGIQAVAVEGTREGSLIALNVPLLDNQSETNGGILVSGQTNTAWNFSLQYVVAATADPLNLETGFPARGSSRSVGDVVGELLRAGERVDVYRIHQTFQIRYVDFEGSTGLAGADGVGGYFIHRQSFGLPDGDRGTGHTARSSGGDIHGILTGGQAGEHAGLIETIALGEGAFGGRGSVGALEGDEDLTVGVHVGPQGEDVQFAVAHSGAAGIPNQGASSNSGARVANIKSFHQATAGVLGVGDDESVSAAGQDRVGLYQQVALSVRSRVRLENEGTGRGEFGEQAGGKTTGRVVEVTTETRHVYGQAAGLHIGARRVDRPGRILGYAGRSIAGEDIVGITENAASGNFFVQVPR